jgi:hypothetical protein
MIDQKQRENMEYFSYFGSMITMMQDAHVKLNPGFHDKISIQQGEDFHYQIGL